MSEPKNARAARNCSVTTFMAALDAAWVLRYGSVSTFQGCLSVSRHTRPVSSLITHWPASWILPIRLAQGRAPMSVLESILWNLDTLGTRGRQILRDSARIPWDSAFNFLATNELLDMDLP